MNNKNEYIYLASGLFNVDTNMYNAYLAKYLEAAGYRCYLPQRDGFEVANFFTFLAAAQQKYTPEVASKVAHYVPYYLDLGYFMSQSIATVANLDDPIDVGMVVEISYAKICNIPVVGLRTDLRSPLGDVTAAIGINPFPVQQCDCYIKAATPTGDFDEVMKGSDKILESIQQKLKELIPTKKNKMTESDNPVIQNIVKGSDILFKDIDDIHTNESMLKMADRFIENEEFFDAAAPQIVTM